MIFKNYTRVEKDTFDYDNILNEYKNFLDVNEERLEKGLILKIIFKHLRED